MKTDVYTKVVLTVIAMALVDIAFKPTGLALETQAEAQPYRSANGPVDINIVSIAGQKFNELQFGGDLLNPAIPVNLSEVGGKSFKSYQIDSSNPEVPVKAKQN